MRSPGEPGSAQPPGPAAIRQPAGEPPATPLRLRLSFRILASLVVLLLTALAAEGTARLLPPQIPGMGDVDNGLMIMMGHPTRLWGMGSGVRLNADTVATIDPIGLRAPVPPVPRPAGRERPMILGDSSFFGHGVDDDQTLSVHLAKRLRSAGIDADAINGGISGYSTDQTRLLMDELGWALQPSLLVIGNLWSDNNFDHFEDRDLLLTQRTYTHWLGRSAFYRHLSGALQRLRGGPGAHIITWTTRSVWPEDGVRRVPVQRYAENLSQLVIDARERGIGAAFLAPCNRDIASGTAPDPAIWSPYFEAQAAVAQHHGLPLLQVEKAIARTVEDQGLDALFLDEMHPTALSNRLVSTTLAAALIRAGWPDKRLLASGERIDASHFADLIPPEPVEDLSLQAGLFTWQRSAHWEERQKQSPWMVKGSVSGSEGPIQLRIEGPQGRPLALEVLPGPGAFSIPLREEGLELTLKASDRAGRKAEARFRKQHQPLSLMLR